MQRKSLLISIPVMASIKGTLFLEFCERYFGPHSSEWWGRSIMTKAELMKARCLFREFYYANFEKRSGTEFISWKVDPVYKPYYGPSDMDQNLDPYIDPYTDLSGVSVISSLQYTAVGKFSIYEQRKIPLFVRNIEKFIFHERPLDWYQSRGIKMNLTDPKNYGIGVKGEHDITPTNSSNALLWEKD